MGPSFWQDGGEKYTRIQSASGSNGEKCGGKEGTEEEHKLPEKDDVIVWSEIVNTAEDMKDMRVVGM